MPWNEIRQLKRQIFSIYYRLPEHTLITISRQLAKHESSEAGCGVDINRFIIFINIRKKSTQTKESQKMLWPVIHAVTKKGARFLKMFSLSVQTIHCEEFLFYLMLLCKRDVFLVIFSLFRIEAFSAYQTESSGASMRSSQSILSYLIMTCIFSIIEFHWKIILWFATN